MRGARPIVATLVLAALSVAALGALTRGDGVPPSATATDGLVEFVDPNLGWRMQVPAAWRIQSYLDQCRIRQQGSVISNADAALPSVESGSGCATGLDTSAGGSEFVGVHIMGFSGGRAPTAEIASPPDTPLPLDPDTFEHGEAGRHRSRSVALGGSRGFNVTITAHSQADPADIATAERIVESVDWYPADAPDEVALTCGESPGFDAPVTVVATRPDGVHVRVHNTRAGDASLDTSHGRGGFRVPPGESVHVLATPPGMVRLRCVAAGETRVWPLRDDAAATAVRIVDPHRAYIGWEFPCDLFVGGVGSGAGPESAAPQSPAEIASTYFESLMQPGDRVRVVGYPQGAEPIVGLERAGRVIQVLHFRGSADTGWDIDSTTACQ